MDYKEKILQAENTVKELKEKFSKLKAIVKTLKVGDTVYEMGTHGGWDMEYYPQEILEIDLENAKLHVHEKSIDKKKWVQSFHTYNDKESKYEYHY
jgi:hypothetical protein